MPSHGEYRSYRRGERRRRLAATVSGTIYTSAQIAADTERPRLSVAGLVEKAVRKYLAETTAKKGARITQRLRYANALLCDVLASGIVIGIAGSSSVANIHAKEPRQLRRNEISQKTAAAFN